MMLRKKMCSGESLAAQPKRSRGQGNGVVQSETRSALSQRYVCVLKLLLTDFFSNTTVLTPFAGSNSISTGIQISTKGTTEIQWYQYVDLLGFLLRTTFIKIKTPSREKMMSTTTMNGSGQTRTMPCLLRVMVFNPMEANYFLGLETRVISSVRFIS